MRREPFLAVGGFEGRFGVGGEEELLALDLAAADWSFVYVPDIVAYHHPSPVRDSAGRGRVQTRNALWTTWLRRPWAAVARVTAGALRAALSDRAAARGLLDAALGLAWVVRARRPVPAEVERAVRAIEAGDVAPAAGPIG